MDRLSNVNPVKSSPNYYIQRNGPDEGPFTIAQINRMVRNGLLAADTPCRNEHESQHRRLDAVFPHLRTNTKADPEKIARIKEEVTTFEINSLIATAFGGGLLCWAPLGIAPLAALTAIGCGLVLLFKHRQLIGLLALALGILGLVVRYYRKGYF